MAAKKQMQAVRVKAETLAQITRDNGLRQTASGAISDFGPQAEAAVSDACKRFPPEFGLARFAGSRFRLSPADSYVSEGRVILYTQRLTGSGGWVAFAKGSPAELAREITE